MSYADHRQQAKSLLPQREALFRTILESAAIGISVNTTDGVPILSNPAMQKMLGYTGDELRTMNYLHFTHPDDRESETLLMADLIAERIDKYQVEKRYICKNGRLMWGRLTVSLLDQRDERVEGPHAEGPHAEDPRAEDPRAEDPRAEEPYYFVAMVEDITDRKRAESESRQREAELEVIAELSLAMRQATSYPQVVESLVERAAAALAARACGLLLLEERGLKLVASRGLNRTTDSFEIPEDDSLAWQVIRSGQATWVSRGADGGHLAVDGPISQGAVPTDPMRTLEPGAALLALVPLRSSDVTMGLLYLAFDEAQELPAGVRRLLDSVADIASTAIQRGKLFQTLEQQVADRTRRLKMLYEVSKAAANIGAQFFDLSTVLPNMLETLVDALPGAAGALQLLDGEATCRPPLVHYQLSGDTTVVLVQGFLPGAPWTRVLRDGLTLQLSKGVRGRRTPDWLQRAGWQAYLGVPVRAGGETIGVLSLFWQTEPRLTIDDLESISTVAGEIARSVERFELRRQAEQALIAEERQRLARDLHDSITQLLCGQGLLAEASRSFAKAGNAAEAEPYLDQLVETSHQALKEMRLMIYNLRPSVLAAEGLVGAIHWRLEAVEQRAGIKAQLTGGITAPLSKQEEEGLYRVVQELLNNVLKHAGASSVAVTLRDTRDGVEVEVSDDGKGFDVDVSRQGIGLKSVHERMERLDGSLEVFSRPGEGCRVVARLRPTSRAC